jgi:hypothetical protein
MRANIDRDKVVIIFDWCKKKFGKSRYWTDYPILRVYQSLGLSLDSEGHGRLGQFNDGIISVFLGHKMTVRTLCNVVLHEYKHYLLNDNEWNKIHKTLVKLGFDAEEAMFIHPHEKKTEQFEKEWGDICYNELKSKLYKKNKKKR